SRRYRRARRTRWRTTRTPPRFSPTRVASPKRVGASLPPGCSVKDLDPVDHRDRLGLCPVQHPPEEPADQQARVVGGHVLEDLHGLRKCIVEGPERTVRELLPLDLVVEVEPA